MTSVLQQSLFTAPPAPSSDLRCTDCLSVVVVQLPQDSEQERKAYAKDAYRHLDLAAQAKAEAEIFGPPVSVYTRAQAIADGSLVDVTKTAYEAGFPCPVALTRAVWIDCVQWTDADRTTDRRRCQDEAGRLWDVLWMGALQYPGMIRRGQAQGRYRIKRVPRSGNTQLVALKLHIGPGDDGRPVATIMFPDES